MESSPPSSSAAAAAEAAAEAVAAMRVGSPASSSRSRDNRLLFDLPASWGYRKPMAFCQSAAAAAAAGGGETQRNSSRSPTKGAVAAEEECPRKQSYLLRDRRAGRDFAEEAGETRKLWNKDGSASGSGSGSGRFSLQLAKQEIEEDFLNMTGRKPPRRAKKRAKNVQRLINTLCPGESLMEVNRDRYKVNEKGGF